MSMPIQRTTSWVGLVSGLIVLVVSAPGAASGQQDTPPGQLPSELRGAKIYRLPEHTKPGQAAEDPVIYKNLSYKDINFERLLLDLYVGIKPVDRAATVRRIYFQNVRVNRIPVHIETFDQEFSLSKKDATDLPAPLKCSIVFSDLDSLIPVKETVELDKLQITGQSFIEVKLSAVERLAMRTKQLVIPVEVKEEVPLNMFVGSPLLRLGASTILETLADPSTAAGLRLAKDRLARQSEGETLSALVRPALYLLYCEYGLVDPKTQAAEKFSQSGTGFVVSADGKLLTAKRVVEPWKFDPQVAFLQARYHLELDPKSYRLYAWPVGAQVQLPSGQLDFQAASSTETQTLKVLKTAPDQKQNQEYRDPESGEQATLSLNKGGEYDIAVLQLVGANFQPLALADSASPPGPDLSTALFSFPFGLSQAQANPQLLFVKASWGESVINLENSLNPGESGAPLLTPEGKVLAFADAENQCVSIGTARTLLQ
jgi:S1-C subfamily serine protease